MKAILVQANGKVDLIDKEWNYHQISEAIGGTIDAVSFGENDYFAFIHDEGKLLGFPENKIATSIWYESGARILLGDYLAGNVLFFGETDEDGNNTDVPNELWVMAVNTQESFGYSQEDEDDSLNFSIDCEMCDGEMFPMGQLGRMIALTCRNCGWAVLMRKEDTNVA